MSLVTVTAAAVSERCFFFFQAEDGIRDLTVTGVQTCALPISIAADVHDASPPAPRHRIRGGNADFPRTAAGDSAGYRAHSGCSRDSRFRRRREDRKSVV